MYFIDHYRGLRAGGFIRTHQLFCGALIFGLTPLLSLTALLAS